MDSVTQPVLLLVRVVLAVSPIQELYCCEMTAAAVATPSASAVAFSSDATTWLYVDDDGVQRGPFSSAQMLAWYNQGYFAPQQLCKPLPPSPSPSASTSGFQAMSSCFPPAMPRSQTVTVAEHKEQQDVSGNERDKVEADSAPNTAEHDNSSAEQKQADEELHGHERDERDGEDEPDDNEQEEEEEEDAEVAARLAALKKSTRSPDPALAGSATGEGEHEWHYIDDCGAVQGPFTVDHMRAWYTAGYFKPHTRVRRDDESDMTEIQHRVHTDFIATARSNNLTTAATSATESATSSAAPTPVPPPAAPPSYSFYTPTAVETDWYYTDRAGIERGPFSTSLMRHWHNKGYFTYNDCPIRAAHTPPSASAPLRLQTAPPNFVLPPPRVTAADGPPSNQQRTRQDEQWLYIDSASRQQGPFSTSAMAQWWRAGYLPHDTRVKRVGEQQWSTIAERGSQCSFVQQAAVAGSVSR